MTDMHKVRVRWSEVTTYETVIEIDLDEILRRGYVPGSPADGWAGVAEYVVEGGSDGLLLADHPRTEVGRDDHFHMVQVGNGEEITL